MQRKEQEEGVLSTSSGSLRPLRLCGELLRDGCMNPARRQLRGARRGAILLEVVLSMAIFVFVATVIFNAMSSSLRRVERMRLENRAQDLAVSVLSEIQMGQTEVADAGPSPFDPDLYPDLTDWEWQVALETVGDGLDMPVTTELTVTVTYPPAGITARLTGFLSPDLEASLAEGSLSGGAP